jgi:outer membrane protein
MSKRFGRVAHNLAALTLSAVYALPAIAQTPTPPPSAQDKPVSKPIAERTVGLEPGKVLKWSLRDAVLSALEKNVDIEIERENVRLAQYDIDGAKGFYDAITTSSINYNALKSPNAFIFSGTAQNFVEQKTFTYNFGLNQAVEKGGGNYLIAFNNNRVLSNTQNFTPQYNPNIFIRYTQPLFRNYKVDLNRRQLKIAKKNLDLSDAVFRQQAINIISRVTQAYWDLALAIRDEEIQRDAVKLAETQLNNNQRQVEVGTLAPIDVVNAAAQLESRRQQVFQAMNAVAIAENSLKALTVDGPSADIWNAQIIPIEPFEIQQITVPLGDALKLAFENRPELKQQALQHEINKLDIDFFKDQMKPQIDLVGSYSMVGLAGTPRANLPPGQIFPDFVGGYGTALGTMFQNEFRTWQVGVNFNFPLRNRVAKANYGRALESQKKIDLQTRSQLQNIEVEVRNAVQAVETSKMRIEASRSARIYAEQQLDGETKRFAAGMGTTFLVLTRQNELAQARGTEQRALADYNKAVAELQRVMSATLTSNSIEIKSVK